MSDTPNRRDDRHEHTRRQALRDLDRVTEQSEVLGSSSMARVANGTRDQEMAGSNPEQEDAIDIWGRRIGRGLALLVAGAIIVYVLNTYVFAQ